ncbi:MAG: hypothetical protein JSW67_02215 [Candidatus Latescibacterota bacterium]|nr:MAG: hypothetical protein JSW67_02215 [Candidatus Latescibacterota bacterium]
MGDSSFITVLSMVPPLVLVVSVAAFVLAWRTRRRAVRGAVAFLLILVGIGSILSTAGTLFSVVGGAVIAAMGLVLLFVSHGPKNAA